jgi:hypothetical protein
MVVVPAPTTVTTPTPPTSSTVATAVLLLVYVNAPLLSLVGAVKLNDASLKFFAGTDNAPILGAMGDTTSDADTVDPPV